MLKKIALVSIIGSFAIICIFAGSSFSKIEHALSLALNTLSDTQSTLKAGQPSDHTIQFVTPSGVASGQSISITLPSGYATGTFAIANFDFATSTSALLNSKYQNNLF